MAASVKFWWHSIDLGEGVITDGWKSSAVLAGEWQSLRLPDLAGKTVLDVGAWDGFYSFECERRGARRVVALDHYVWSLDLPEQQRYWRDCRAAGVVPEPYESRPDLWHPDTLPGKRGFDTAHRALGSKVEPRVEDFMSTDLDQLGHFDVVLFLGVLYHLKDPLGGLQRLAQTTAELAVIETEAIAVPGFEHYAMCEFFESNELGDDVSNWWAPNMHALLGMCRAAGFSRAEPVSNVLDGAAVAGTEPIRYRPVVHAWR